MPSARAGLVTLATTRLSMAHASGRSRSVFRRSGENLRSEIPGILVGQLGPGHGLKRSREGGLKILGVGARPDANNQSLTFKLLLSLGPSGPEDKKKAVMKAKLEMKIKKVQAKLDFLKEMQKIFG